MPRHERASKLYYRHISHLLVFPVGDFGLILPLFYEFIHIYLFYTVGRRYFPQERNRKSNTKILFCWDVTLCY
jgi:hypothetical protein